MAIFPYIDLSRFICDEPDCVAPLNGAIPLAGLAPGGTSGVMPGLETAVSDVLSNYNPGDIGICEIDDKLQLSMPVPLWAEYQYAEDGSLVVAAGVSVYQVFFTVPYNRRFLLQSFALDQDGAGDNQIVELAAFLPPGYGAGTNKIRLTLTSGAVRSSWPNIGAQSELLMGAGPSPVLLEPGSTVGALFSGTGVAITTYDAFLFGCMIPIVRSLTP